MSKTRDASIETSVTLGKDFSGAKYYPVECLSRHEGPTPDLWLPAIPGQNATEPMISKQEQPSTRIAQRHLFAELLVSLPS